MALIYFIINDDIGTTGGFIIITTHLIIKKIELFPDKYEGNPTNTGPIAKLNTFS